MCNRRCPDCCAREALTWFNPGILEPEIDLDELRWAGEILGVVKEVEITGGEPTMHSKFAELSERLRALFRCNDFTLVTNGWLFQDPEKLPLLLNYTGVYLTHYLRKFPGGANTREVENVKGFLAGHPEVRLVIVPMDSHAKYSDRPYGGIPCGHEKYQLAYYEHKLFGCCVAWSQMNQGIPIPLTEDWRSHVDEIEIPCGTCFLSKKEG